MKIFPCACAAIMLASGLCPAVSQDHDSWDIATYDPPDYTYREFIIVPELSINNSDSSHTTTNSLSTEREASLFSSAHYALYPAYRFHRYTKRFELGGRNFISARNDALPFTKNETDNYAADSKYFYKSRSLELSIETRDSARLYFPSGSFIGALAHAGFSAGNEAVTSGSAVYSKFDSLPMVSYNKNTSAVDVLNPSFSLFIGGGWGRIRDVTFGAVALNMLDRLRDVLPSSEGISADKVRDFAAFIEKRRRLRAFDDRLALIGNIDTLSRYLIDKRVLSGPSSAATMELADQWLYAFSQNRQAGLEFSLYPGIMFDYSRHNSSDNSGAWIDSLAYDLQLADADADNARKSRSYEETAYRQHQYQTQLTYCLNSTFQAAKPMSRFFQISGRIDLNFHWNHYFARNAQSDIAEVEYETLLPTMEAGVSCLFAYYPDTRTAFTFGPNVSYNRSYNYLINGNKIHGTPPAAVKNDLHFDFRRTEIELPLSLLYYVSPRLLYRISAATYTKSDYGSDQSTTKGWYYTYAIGAGLTYQVF